MKSSSMLARSAMLIALGLSTTSCSESEDSGPIPADLSYEIIAEDALQDERRSLDVRLSHAVSEDILESLAYRLRDQADQRFNRTFIVYYLPGMEVGAGGWATSHFNPDLQVRILGLSADARSPIPSFRDEYGDDLLGVWENNQPGSASTLVLHTTGSGIALERIFPDGSSRSVTLREEQGRGGRQFRDPDNDLGEFWLLREGNLELHDPEGRVFVAWPAER